jgi:uncharacterized membrane protein HdeD (DUF308 family)
MLEKLKKFAWGYEILALLLIAVGVCFIAFCDTFKIIAITVGAVLTVAAIVFAVLTLIDKRRGVVFALRIVLSAIMTVGGVTVMIANDVAVPILTDIFCLFIIVDASFALHTVTQVPRARSPIFWILLVLSVAVIISAFLLTGNAPAELAVLSTIFGIVMIADGVLNAVRPFYNHKGENAEEKE